MHMGSRGSSSKDMCICTHVIHCIYGQYYFYIIYIKVKLFMKVSENGCLKHSRLVLAVCWSKGRKGFDCVAFMLVTPAVTPHIAIFSAMSHADLTSFCKKQTDSCLFN